MAGPVENEVQSIFGSPAQQARANVSLTAGENPDEIAEAQRTARALGIPYTAVQTDPSLARRQMAVQGIDWGHLEDTAPRTTRFLAAPQNAAVAHDDVGVLGSIENWASNAGSFLAAKGTAGLHGVVAMGAGILDTINPWTTSDADLAVLYKNDPAELARMRASAPAALSQFAIGQQRTAARVGQNMSPGAKAAYGNLRYATTDPSQAAYLSPVKMVGDILESAPPAIALATSAYLTRGVSLRAEAAALAEGATAEAAQAAGTQAAVQFATRFGAASMGTVAAGGAKVQTQQQLEDLPESEWLKSPQYSALIQQGYAPAAARLYLSARAGSEAGLGSGLAAMGANEIGGEFLGRILGEGGGALARFGKGFLSGGATMAVQGAGQQLSTNIAERDNLNPNRDITDGLLESAAGGFVTGGLMTGPLGALLGRHGQDSMKASEALHANETITNLMRLSDASALRKRAPETFHDFMEGVTEGTGHEEGYIHPEKLVEALHQGGLDDKQMAAVEAAIGPHLDQAVREGTDVRLPMADLATHLAGTGAEKLILDNMKADPNGFTPAEAEAFMQGEGAKKLQADLDTIAQAHTKDEAWRQSADQVKGLVKEQLGKAGRFTSQVNDRYAELHAAFYQAMATRLGMQPHELYEQHPVRVTADHVDNAERLNQSDGPLVVYRGENTSNRGGGYYSTDRDFARQFTQSGAPEEVKAAAISPDDVYTPEELPRATKEHEFDAAIEAAKAAGKKAIRVDEGEGEPHSVYVFDKTALKPHMATDAEGFHQKNRGAYAPATDTITLMHSADLSTYLHESGHFFLEMLNRMADRSDAPQQIKGDFDTLLKWFGVKDRETWNAMSLDEKRDAHEKFARGFEKYLFEGEAPSSGLRKLFRAFRSWMIAVYKKASALRVGVSRPVRDVMDRMLASDEEIAHAEAARSIEPLFDNREQVGMSEDQWRAYQKLGEDAHASASEDLETRSLKDMQWLTNARGREIARLKRQAVQTRKETRARVAAEVAEEPLYKAINFMRKGDEGVDGAHKLYTPEVRDALGLNDGEPLPTALAGMTSTENGVHPEQVADRFGFTSADHMLKSIVMGEKMSERVDGLTDQRLLEEHGDLNDPHAIEAAANRAVHNEMRGRVLATQLGALEKAVGSRKTLVEAAKKFAAQTIDRQRVRDIRPAVYEAAERRAGEATKKALKAADLQTAAVEQRNQLLNFYTHKAALEAVEAADRAKGYFDRVQRANALKNMRGPFRIQLQALLDRFDLRTSATRAEMDTPVRPINEWLQSEAERLSAVMPMLPDFVLNDGFKTHFRNLTVEQLRGLVDSVKQIEMLARREQKQYLAIRGMEFDAEKAALLDRIRQTYPHAFDPITGSPRRSDREMVPTIGKALKRGAQEFDGEMTSPETFASRLDGSNTLGPAHESLFSRLSDRSNWKASELGQVTELVKPLFDAYSYVEKRQFGRKGYFIPEIGDSMTKENMLVTALLAGSEDGRARLANDGWGPEHINAIVDRLDERDWNLADGIWRLFDEHLWPQLEALNKRTAGASPPKVEALPYETKFGTARGGYFRLKYDGELEERVHNMEEGAAVQALLGHSNGMSAKTDQSTSIERKDNVTLRPRLDLGVFIETVEETVHDLAYREAVADTIKMLNDQDVRQALKGSLGTPEYRAMVHFVRRIAAPRADPMSFVGRFMNVARRNTVMNMMSGVKTAVVHMHGLVPAFDRVSPGSLAPEILKMFSPLMLKRLAIPNELSEFMRARTDNFDRDIQEQAMRFTPKGEVIPGRQHLLWLMTNLHKTIDAAVWNGAFRDGMREHDNDTDKAVRHADHVVRQTQGGGRDVDLAKLSGHKGDRGEFVKLFTAFHSFFFSQLNMLVRAGAVSRQMARTNPVGAAARFAASYMLISAIPAAMYQALFARHNDDETADETVKRHIGGQFEYPSNFMPGGKALYTAAWHQIAPEEPYFGIKVSPIQSTAESLLEKGPKAISHVIEGEGSRFDAKELATDVGYLTGTPGKLVGDVIAGGTAIAQGEAGPEALYTPPTNHAPR